MGEPEPGRVPGEDGIGARVMLPVRARGGEG